MWRRVTGEEEGRSQKISLLHFNQESEIRCRTLEIKSYKNPRIQFLEEWVSLLYHLRHCPRDKLGSLSYVVCHSYSTNYVLPVDGGKWRRVLGMGRWETPVA